jgi:hypothetical protein
VRRTTSPGSPGLPGPAPTSIQDDLYCAILKVYSGLSGRRACGVYANVADRGLLSRAPSFAVASNLLRRPEVTPILYRLLQLSALPLAGLEDGGAVAPDSTGIQTTSFGGWREEKHGEKREKRWLKVHAMVGTKTHVDDSCGCLHREFRGLSPVRAPPSRNARGRIPAGGSRR